MPRLGLPFFGHEFREHSYRVATSILLGLSSPTNAPGGVKGAVRLDERNMIVYVNPIGS